MKPRPSGRRSRLAVWLLPLISLVAPPPGAEPPARTEAIERGTRGVALTVVEGNRVEEIPLSFLGTYRDFAGPGYDLHLVRLEGPIADAVGVAAGMSGSPVYIDGELIGALSYRLGALPRDPVAGVTPLRQMIEADKSPPSTHRTSDFDATSVRPIGTPLVVGGLLPPVRQWLGEQLAEMGFVVTGGGRASPEATTGALRPGSPVGVELARGDLGIAATGTVTWVDEDRVYAFGHPFLGSGPVELPMVRAEVVHTLADLAGSVKLANVGSEVGAIVDDRLTAVVGQLGRKARMMPLALAIRGSSYGTQQLRFEIARTTRLAPFVTAAVVANSLLGNVGYDDEATVRARGRIRFTDLPDLPLDMSFASAGGADPSLSIAIALQQILSALWANPFTTAEVEGIELDVEVRPEIVRFRVEEVLHDRGPVRAGQELKLRCRLRRYRGASELHELSVRIPKTLPPGKILILAVGAPAEIERAIGRPITLRAQSAPDLDGVIRALAELPAAHRLTAVLVQRGVGIVSRGELYEGLPPTAARLLGAAADTPEASLTRVALVDRSFVELDGPVDGGIMVRLQVEPDWVGPTAGDLEVGSR